MSGTENDGTRAERQAGGAAARPLSVTVDETGQTLTLGPARLVIGGYTARDEAAVRAHIDELAAIGVPPPAAVPSFYELPADLLTTSGTIDVAGGQTSGEAEPVLLRSGGRYYLAVGSDHTDRELERDDISAAKAACPKPVGPVVSPLPEDLAAADWDSIEIESRVDGRPYQRGRLAELRSPGDLLARLAGGPGDPGGDMVMFCGTIPLLTGAFVPGTRWELALRLPRGRVLAHAYETKRSAP